MALPGAPNPPTSSFSGARSVLQYTGIPSAFLKLPKFKLPSRNWLIFLSITGGFTSLYAYDRRECERIKAEYVDKVKHLADAPIGALEKVRCVRVLAAKSPGDDDAKKGLTYFKKYVKPILVAAALDYDMTVGQRHGSLATLLSREIHRKRLIAAGVLPPPVSLIPGNTPEDLERRAMEGGIVLVGRVAFKEYMEGLRRGWGEELTGSRVREEDLEEAALAQDLEGDGRFDDPDDMPVGLGSMDEPSEPPIRPQAPSFKNPFLPDSLQFKPTPPSRASSSGTPIPPPSRLPPQPPILLLPFTNLVGMSLVPRQIWGFFNRRHRVRSGGEHALMLIFAHTRPLEPHNDLDFDIQSERLYLKSFDKVPDKIAKAREEYYAALPARLATARALARSEREPTKDEVKFPPMTEQELRAERFNKEKRWREDERGWEIVKRGSGVRWEETWDGALNVYRDEPSWS